MIRYSIKDLEKITGIKAHTIRIWEKRYELIVPSRTQTNIRYYSDEDLRLLMNVAMLNKYGYKISSIQSLSFLEIIKLVSELSNQYSDFDHQVGELVLAMLELNEQKFDAIISASIIKEGFEATFEGLIFKFLEKVGILWQLGKAVPAQEHFITQLIRQKLISAIDTQLQSIDKRLTFLLFLPENEYHEIGLLYSQYLIRKAGNRVIYLGQNVPISNLKNVFELHHIDYLLTSLTSNQPVESLIEITQELGKLFHDKLILLGGNCFVKNEIYLPNNFTTFDTLQEFASFLKKL